MEGLHWWDYTAIEKKKKNDKDEMCEEVYFILLVDL